MFIYTTISFGEGVLKLLKKRLIICDVTKGRVATLTIEDMNHSA